MTGVWLVEFRATGNGWDAPIGIYRWPDGRHTIRRDGERPPGWVLEDGASEIVMPHGTFWLDGQMSEFDRKRQPSITDDIHPRAVQPPEHEACTPPVSPGQIDGDQTAEAEGSRWVCPDCGRRWKVVLDAAGRKVWRPLWWWEP